MEKLLNLNDISNLSLISESYSHAGQDYVFSHLVFNNNITTISHEPLKFDGLTVLILLKGNLEITINSNVYTITPGSVGVMGPSDIIGIQKSESNIIEMYTLFLSTEFLKGINFDVNVINPRFLINQKPTISLKDDELALVCTYLDLLHRCAVNNSNAPQQLTLITRSIGRNIVVSLMYQLAYITELRYIMDTTIAAPQGSNSHSRKINYVHDFMSLLQQHYRKERTVAFYASKMCISPKYLSLLVRDVTGRTAADIIDRYVINEAKNMLRYSGYTIQQIAYKLNFPNQSAFGKYFKHITGMSPTSFRSN